MMTPTYFSTNFTTLPQNVEGLEIRRASQLFMMPWPFQRYLK
jgi:hypothetical protein